MPKELTGAELLVRCLEAQQVKYIFGIPGAKIDAVFDALVDSDIRLIVCRHEQNAAFMAACYGRLTGRPGVVLVTSGPGVANLSTALLTATTEGDPVVAIGGNVSREMLLKASHQQADNVQMMSAVSKFHVEVNAVEAIPEVVENAFRAAMMPPSGASFISLPQDITHVKTATQPFASPCVLSFGEAQENALAYAAGLINTAQQPVLLLGQEASRPGNAVAIRQLLHQHRLPVVSTFQAAGVIPRELLPCFVGRVGLFKNQPGDVLLSESDLVVAIGFNPAEYDPEIWNNSQKRAVVHIDYQPCQIRRGYHPTAELVGDIAANLKRLAMQLVARTTQLPAAIAPLQQSLQEVIASGSSFDQVPLHPLRFIHALTQVVNDEDLVICDVGSVYMWMARYFFTYRPHHLLFSNGQQTLGVAMPWAIGANFAHPKQRVISISGDGGFLFSAQALETAVRERCRFVHCVWTDGAYNMVLEQQKMKYQRSSGVALGALDLVAYANAFGAIGHNLTKASELVDLLQEALLADRPVLINIPIDYSDNPALFAKSDPNLGH